MKLTLKKISAVILISVFMFVVTPLFAAGITSDLTTQINAINGLSAVTSGNTVTVTGTNENITTPLTLNIPSGVTVNWEAIYTGSVSPASTSMITVNGNGTFEVVNNGTILNIGTGNTLNVAGAGTVIRVNTGGTIQSSRSGSAILILTEDVEVEVGTAGSVISLDGNVNAAIQVGGGSAVSGNVINVNGGSVISIGTGFAINDGAGTALLDNDTRITVTGGVVIAGGNSAIHSTGIRSSVDITGGIISNTAGNNLNPTIDMQGDMTDATPLPVYNITLSGTAVVQSTSVNGYAVQTKGNVLVQRGAAVSAINGRAINLVGLDSTALISGGVVETTGSGTAISTATTNVETVVRASIVVTGGTVVSESGYAINATGVNSNITVSGGSVSTSSTTNHAINATGAGVTITVSGGEVSAISTDAIRTTATNSSAVTVSGNACVSSVTGRAIQANSTGAAVTIGGSSQVWVLNAGNAIRCTGGTVQLNSGFVFAYGTSAGGAINSPHINVTTGGGALVLVWNEAAGRRLYPQGSSAPTASEDLNLGFSGSNANFWWHDHPTLGGGINYAFPPNVGFFPIPEVSIYRDFGLIFVSATGRMYRNVDGNQNPLLDSSNVPLSPNNVEFYSYREGYVFPPAVPQWGASPGQLRLYGFSWTTNMLPSVPAAILNALTIIGNTEIVINGDSRFEAAHPSGTGIKFGTGSEAITFRGNSTLRAVGSNSPGIGIDIGNGGLTIAGGTFIAQAGRAIKWDEFSPSTGRVTSDPSTFDYSWTFSQNFDGTNGTTGYGVDVLFELFETDLFVMLKPVTPVNFISAVQIGGVSHTVDSVAIALTFDTPVYGLTADDITINFDTGITEKGVLVGSGRDWVLTLSSVDAEGLIEVVINSHFSDFFVDQNRCTLEIYKEDKIVHDIFLTNTVQDGGDFEQLFEFEILFVSDPREPQPVPLTTDPDDPEAFLVTYANPNSLPPGRITGADNNVLLLKHGEAIKIYGLPIGFYFVSEHQNQGFITAFDIDSEGWFTAPNGISRIFRLTTDVVIDTFNSIVLEEPGEPERPFDPDNPEVIIEPDAFNLILTKTVQPGGDFEQLFEFEVLIIDDNGNPRASALSIDPIDEDTFYVTYTDGSQLPPDHITGNDYSVLLLKHDEAVLLRNLPVGQYMIKEHVNDGFITAFNINSEGWFTAPDGLSRQFRHDSETTAECFNSIVPEVPGEPSRPIDPENPEEPYIPDDTGDPPGDREKSPQTGINRDPALPVVIIILSVITLITAEVYRKKTKNR